MGAFATLFGGVVSAAGTIIGGYQEAAGMKWQAAENLQFAQADKKALNLQADQSIGAAQVNAEQQDMDTNLLLSRERAVAASSGAGGVETATVAGIMGDTAQRGAYLRNLAMWRGETEANAKRAAGNAAVAQARLGVTGANYAARNAQTNSILAGAGEALSAGGSAYKQYRYG